MSKTAAEIRREFVEFFCRKHGHTHVPGAPVIPYDDPTLLFTNAGMNQFKPLFLGTADRGSEFGRLKRAANSQPCIRAGGKHNDLDDVGHDTYHHTFFEMLGNWSFGDYFKKEAIEWAWELITKVWGIDPSRIHATYFGGDPAEGLEPDLEARDLWCGVPGMSPERVHPGNKKDNFWEMGDTGPCGPCSEMHIDLTPDRSGGPLVNAGDERVIEFWNLVFIQFNRGPDGKLSPLPAKHVDTGMGFERITRIVQGKRSNYDIDVFTPIFAAIQRVSGAAAYGGRMEVGEQGNKEAKEQGAGHADLMRDVAYRVIADHIRTLTFAISDGCPPDKDGRGFVLRRILRRAVRYGWQYLGLKKPFLCELVPTVVEVMGDSFPRLRGPNKSGSIGVSPVNANQTALKTLELPAPPSMSPERVAEIIRDEEQAFARTLDRGIALFEDAAQRATKLPNPDREGGAGRAVRTDAPQAYLITFRTYGSWLPGSPGTVDESHNIPGEEYAPVNENREYEAAKNLKHEAVLLDDRQRSIIENTIREVAEHRGWEICAINVRTNHVHVVVAAAAAPEKVMNDFKAYATRRMKEANALPNPDRKGGATTEPNPDRKGGAEPEDTVVWARHGSTRYLWDAHSVGLACDYVLDGQGNPLPTESPGELPHADQGRPLPHGRGSDRVSGVISGVDAFKLHDTFGFPIDLTEIMAQERGLRVDIGEYERLMEEARDRAREAGRGSGDWASALPTSFVASLGRTLDTPKYTAQVIDAEIVSLFCIETNGRITFPPKDGALHAGQRGVLILNRTVFYAEQGGQCGDTGLILTNPEESESHEVFCVEDTIRLGNSIAHVGQVRRGGFGWSESVFLKVSERRLQIEHNHTATHLLNLALRNTLGNHIDQNGSLVDPEKTRFDFSHPKPLTPEELEAIEQFVYTQITRNLPVYAEVRPQGEARSINTLRAVFGEKYPDQVRVVSIGVPVADLLANPANPDWMNYSVEFCGGTHVANTGEIDTFVLVQEEAVSKGVRRLVGVSGQTAKAAIAIASDLMRESARLRVSVTGADLATGVLQLQKRVDESVLPLLYRRMLRDQFAKLQEKLKAEEKQRATESIGDVMSKVEGLLSSATRKGETTIVVAEMGDAPIDALKTAADAIKQKSGSAAILFGVKATDKATILAAVTDDLIKKGIKAGDWIKAVAPIVEGGGGGPPTMAQAGGKNPAKLGEALETGKAWLLGKL